MSSNRLAELLAPTMVVLFDFDGPVCSIFAAQPASGVARELRQLLAGITGQQLGDTEATDDPMQVLRQSVRYGPRIVAEIDEALAVAELDAVRAGAEPTPASARCIRAVVDSGRCAAVVTNNADRAARAYLEQHGLDGLVSAIVGRHPGRPDLMKPDGWPLVHALASFPTHAKNAIFVGDTRSDIQAARATGTYAIGYANKPGKHQQLAGADVVIDDMAELAETLEHLTKKP